MILGKQKTVVANLAALSARRSEEITKHQTAINDWKRERLASTGSLALFFAAGILWGGRKKVARQPGEHSTAGRKAASAANTSLLLWRLFNNPAQG